MIFYALLDLAPNPCYTSSMKFHEFTIITSNELEAAGEVTETILINEDHIVSIKPINIVIDGDVVEGVWIRTSNGKKYRAVEIPQSFQKYLK